MDSISATADVLRRVVEKLAVAEVPYMLTGSFASAAYGTPRATQDIDLVIAPKAGTLMRLLTQFPENEYYVSREAALDAYARESLFNVVDFETGWKVDFVICKAREFSQTEFSRRRKVTLFEQELYAASPEDVVLAKLEWAKLAGSTRQIEDVIGILRVASETLDISYIESWVPRLEVEEQWAAASTTRPSA